LDANLVQRLAHFVELKGLMMALISFMFVVPPQ